MSTDDVEPRRVEGIVGTVERGPFGTGSKSAREAIWFNTLQGRFVLRRKDGPTFGDTALNRYVGKRVTCSGFIVGYSLLADRISVAGEA
ncbi:MAG TPA: hypothetical protein VJT81_17180 [Burkholderiales bacterium]|nr:hypothetical protein [Burkholderiales bacterium]